MSQDGDVLRKATPEEMAGQAREMIEARGEQAVFDPSLESALQMREALRAEKEVEDELMDTDSLADLPRLSRRFAETNGRATAALGVLQAECCLPETPRHPRRDQVTIRG
jgi:hypothetical protein